MIEFTGERVIPGQVEPDLWNEHLARYHFAARLAAARRVLDAGCGSGYGAAELARSAAAVIGLDNAPEALAYARAHFPHPSLTWVQASIDALPFPPARFDLVVCFEVIEHLPDPQPLLAEFARVLAPHGQLIISTPNKEYYAETRAQTGPNPYHHHEFTFPEFRDLLIRHFPHVSFFVQNHGAAVIFQPLRGEHAQDVFIEDDSVNPNHAHFLIAVCAKRPQLGAPSFIYLPQTSNVLREREHHIQLLEAELRQKDAWLSDLQAAHADLHSRHQALTEELAAANRWATQLDEQLTSAGNRILQLQDEVASRNAWALQIQQELDQKLQELQTAVNALHNVEAELARTQAELAHTLQSYLDTRDQLEKALAKLRMIRDSRWVKLGRTIRLGPDLTREALD